MLFGLQQSELLAAGSGAGLRTAREAFADRAYRADGTLVPRSEPGAVIDDPVEVLDRVIGMARDPNVDTICVYGDTPGAAYLDARFRQALEAAQIAVRILLA